MTADLFTPAKPWRVTFEKRRDDHALREVVHVPDADDAITAQRIALRLRRTAGLVRIIACEQEAA